MGIALSLSLSLYSLERDYGTLEFVERGPGPSCNRAQSPPTKDLSHERDPKNSSSLLSTL